jgi:hypothetical protein
MTGGPEQEPTPVDLAPQAPLDQTTAPIDHLQEGLGDDVPLDQTRSEMRVFLGSQDIPERRVPRES